MFDRITNTRAQIIIYYQILVGLKFENQGLLQFHNNFHAHTDLLVKLTQDAKIAINKQVKYKNV